MKIMTLQLEQTNCYFLINEKTNELIVVDPAFNFKTIKAKIDEMGLKTKYILLTHGHFDHIMALEELREATGAPVMINEGDAPCLTDPSVSYMLKFMGKAEPGKPGDAFLTDGQIITLGDEKITVMHTPGHSAGSCCFITDKFIVSGDTLFLGSVGRYDFNTSSYEQQMQSLERLKNIEGDREVYPGHGPATTLERERMYNPYFD